MTEALEVQPSSLRTINEPLVARALDVGLSEGNLDPAVVTSIASLGCGNFLEAPLLQRTFPNAQIEGIDIYRDVGVEKIGGNDRRVSFIRKDLARKRSLGTAKYDICLVRNPDSFSDKWGKIFRNSHLGLRGNGMLIVTSSGNDTDRISSLIKEAGFAIYYKSPISEGDNYGSNWDEAVVVARKI